MSKIFVVFTLFLVSCKSLTETEKLHKALSGHWILLYPDHVLKNDHQKFLYASMQDSIVALKGLKLISLKSNGSFEQIDSINTHGSWGLTSENIFFIQKGGKGFENFSARYTEMRQGVLKVTETIEKDGEKISLVWHLKKITGGKFVSLFGKDRNHWRIKPGSEESELQIRSRLSEMLSYYSDYYSLVTQESSFFVPARVVLPLKFYQHALGMDTYRADSPFSRLFYNETQAMLAHKLLKNTIRGLSDEYPAYDNYVKEYAAFMKLMAEKIKSEP